jgi:hypothetical protein
VVLDPTLSVLMRLAERLTDYAWKYRYPGLPVEPPAAEADEAIESASAVLDAILERLPAEVRP